mgnify:FL=1
MHCWFEDSTLIQPFGFFNFHLLLLLLLLLLLRLLFRYGPATQVRWLQGRTPLLHMSFILILLSTVN